LLIRGVGGHDHRAIFDEGADDRRAQLTRRTRDERSFSFQTSHRDSPDDSKDRIMALVEVEISAYYDNICRKTGRI
jgi:hypothetical protein